MATTPRFALRYPVAADANNVPTSMLNLATDLDNKMSAYISGSFATRPAFGTQGRWYFSTDSKDVSFDTGAAWRSLTGSPTIPCARLWQNANPAAGSAPAVIAWNQTTFNRNGTAVAATKIIVPVAGYWRVRAHQRFNIGGTGNSQALLQIRQGPNSDTAGTVIAQAQKSANWSLAFDNDISVEVETLVNLAAGGDFAIWQATSVASTLYGSSSESFVEYELVTAT